jgi:hypothetical protein
LCELATLSLVAGIAGAGVSAAGSIQQGQAQKSAADYQAAVDRNNAILSQRQARDAVERGQADQQTQMRKNADALGRARASYASRGVEGNFGSPLDVMGDMAQFGTLDAKTIGVNAQREAAGYEAQAMNQNASATLKQQQGNNAAAAGNIGAFGSLLSGATSVASNWYKMK